MATTVNVAFSEFMKDTVDVVNEDNQGVLKAAIKAPPEEVVFENLYEKGGNGKEELTPSSSSNPSSGTLGTSDDSTPTLTGGVDTGDGNSLLLWIGLLLLGGCGAAAIAWKKRRQG